jgi:hypothetical protein
MKRQIGYYLLAMPFKIIGTINDEPISLDKYLTFYEELLDEINTWLKQNGGTPNDFIY